MSSKEEFARFAGLVDLAAEKIGGEALSCSDEFFAGKENLLKPGRGVFIEDKYTDNGKWMDGWESRRSRRDTGHDWCIIKLGVPGDIQALDIDTNHFLGNHPQYAAVDAFAADGKISARDLEKADWQEVLPQSTLRAGSQNLFALRHTAEATHVRLRIYPDGGVARLRIYGHVLPQVARGGEFDLLAVENGGRALVCSDMFFSSMENLIMPGRAKDMSDGWETKRSRVPGHFDWVILRLAGAGTIKKFEIDTNHFKGNFPESCVIEGVKVAGESLEHVLHNNEWQEILPRTKLEAHKRHFFDKEILSHPAITHVRLTIYPDGGISRLRAVGTLA